MRIPEFGLGGTLGPPCSATLLEVVDFETMLRHSEGDARRPAQRLPASNPSGWSPR
jgi:hypothetical protein